MCGGGGGNPNAGINYQKKMQQQRQQRVAAGLKQINAMFSGGTVGTSPISASAFDPTKTYYDGAGNVVYDPSMNTTTAAPAPAAAPAPVHNDGGRTVRTRYGTRPASTLTPAPAAPQPSSAVQKAKALAKQGLLFGATNTYTGFTPQWYQQQATSYENYANPQLNRQYRQAGDALTYQLARQGLLKSSAATKRRADLGQTYQQAQQNIANTAQGYVGKAKSAVSQERSNLVNALEASGDPSFIPQTATNAIDALRAQPAYQSLGQVFQNATAGMGNYLAGQRYYNMTHGVGNGVFSLNPSGSATTVGG